MYTSGISSGARVKKMLLLPPATIWCTTGHLPRDGCCCCKSPADSAAALLLLLVALPPPPLLGRCALPLADGRCCCCSSRAACASCSGPSMTVVRLLPLLRCSRRSLSLLEGWKGRCSLMGMGTVRSGLMRCRLPGTCVCVETVIAVRVSRGHQKQGLGQLGVVCVAEGCMGVVCPCTPLNHTSQLDHV